MAGGVDDPAAARPKRMDHGYSTTAPPWWRCLARQVIPRRRTRDCCYYHRVNWRQVSAAAIRVTRQARRTAMLDAGVRRTVIVRWRYPS